MTIKLTILVDDQAGPVAPAEHGFSLWIEAGTNHVLFVTGQNTAAIANAQLSDIHFADAATIVLSHGHYDHTGGLAAVLRQSGPDVRVCCHRDVVQPRYGLDGQVPKSVGMPAASLQALQQLADSQRLWTGSAEMLSEMMGVTGPIPRTTPYEDAGGPLFLDPEGCRPDPFLDDQALWIRTREGLIVVAGCAHAGIVNTLQYVRQLAGDLPIRAVIGGFHLLHANDHRLEQTVDDLRSLAPEEIIPCHCTGNRAVQLLQDAFGKAVSRGFAGRQMEFPA